MLMETVFLNVYVLSYLQFFLGWDVLRLNTSGKLCFVGNIFLPEGLTDYSKLSASSTAKVIGGEYLVECFPSLVYLILDFILYILFLLRWRECVEGGILQRSGRTAFSIIFTLPKERRTEESVHCIPGEGRI